MKTGRSTFANGIQSANYLAAGTLDFTKFSSRNPPHLVMVAWAYRAEFKFRIDIDKFFKKARDLRYLDLVDVIRKMPQIDPHMFDMMIRIHYAPAFLNLGFNGPGNKVARCQFFHLRGIFFHERLNIFVAQNIANRSQRFAGKNSWSYNSV